MIAELIFVGTELLLGNIVNTNAAFLSEQCAGLGLSVYYQTVVGDNRERLKETIETAKRRADVIVLGGGLGPTEDDLTKETAAEVFGKELVCDEHSKMRILEYFEKLGREPSAITKNNWKQAEIPKGAIAVDNDNGTAPGIILEAEGKIVLMLPGPPNELIPMWKSQIVPYLKSKQPDTIESVTLKVCGMGESRVETEILDLIDAQTNPTIATYAKTGEVHIRLTAKAKDEESARALIEPVAAKIRARLGRFLYTEEEEVTLEQAVVELLKAKEMTVTTVESCTGGLLSGRIINAPGASEVFKEGFVTYSNKAKRKLAGVSKSTLKTYTAVSRQTAAEMAEGGRKAAKADACLSVTGIAGPDGGTAAQPVGLVYIGCCVSGKTVVRKYQFTGNRQKVRDYAVVSALTLLRECLLEQTSCEEKI